MDAFFNRLARSRAFSAKSFQLTCAVCGILCSLFFFFAFVAMGNLPPMKPWWTAEETVEFWKKHRSGAHVGAAFLLISGMFYLPFSAAISAQIRRIPNIHPAIASLQIASAAAGIFTFMLPGMILGTVTYRLDRNTEVTQALNDMFWLVALMPWPTFMAQNFSFAYAIILDTRPKPLFPKYVAFTNFIVPLLFVPSIAMHVTTRGPVAYNGAFSFWIPGLTFCGQLIFDAGCLVRAILVEYSDNGADSAGDLDSSTAGASDTKVA